jgi:hypothetical protein
MSKRSMNCMTPFAREQADRNREVSRRARPRLTSAEAALIALVLLLSACAPGRVSESIAILRDIQAGPGPSALKDATLTPLRQPISYSVARRARQADLYTPEGQPVKAGMIFVPGLTPRGRNDDRVIAFANTLARAGFRVLVPDVPNLRRFTVSGEDTVLIADAVCAAQANEAALPFGIAAVSFAVGPAVGALFEPQAEGRVDFVLSIGGYYDMTALITYVTTGYYRRSPDQPWQYRMPKRYGKWVFLLTNAVRLNDLDDKLALIEVAQRKLDDPEADVEDLMQRLGPEGQAVHALLVNTDPERVPALMAALPASVRREADALDLSQRNVAAPGSRFLLVHDRTDRIIPADQSLIFAAAAGHAEVFLVSGLDHAEPKEMTAGDAVEMLDAVYSLLKERDRGERSRLPCPEAVLTTEPGATAAAS